MDTHNGTRVQSIKYANFIYNTYRVLLLVLNLFITTLNDRPRPVAVMEDFKSIKMGQNPINNEPTEC